MKWQQTRSSRRGSMQLSIEAIIILVIAFVLLGLAIVFVKGFFTKAGDATDNYINQVGSACNTANRDNPITPTEFEIEQGDSKIEEICVLNNADRPIENGVLQFENCIDADGRPTTTAVKLVSGPLGIMRGESKAYKATIKANETAMLGKYICNIFTQKSASPTDAKVGPIQVTIEVN